MIIAYASNNEIPNGYLLCDGSEINRITYSKLFNIIGTIYGEGNSETTFNLPNLINNFIQGSNISGTYITAGLPNIEGTQKIRTNGLQKIDGAYTMDKATIKYYSLSVTPTSDLPADILTFNASLSNSIYNNSTTVQPPALTMRYLIKYN